MKTLTDAQLKTFLATFNHTGLGDVKRDKFILFARKGSTGDYEAIGYKQESAAISNNYDTQSLTDVLGNKYNDINDKDEQIEMSEYKINETHSPFLDTAFEYTIAGLESELTDYELLMVCSWLTTTSGSTTSYLTRKVTNVTLTLDNLGGQGHTMADVTFGGISRGIFGTVDSLTTPIFTEHTPA